MKEDTKVDAYELYPEDKEKMKKKMKKVLTKRKVLDIIDSEIKQFERNDHMLMVSVLKKVKNKIVLLDD